MPARSLKRFRKGVSLVEVLVSMFVFTLMIASMMSVFVTLIRKRSDIRQSQQHSEELSLSMGYVMKKVRMSDEGSCGSGSDVKTCSVIDHVTGDTLRYEFLSDHTLSETITSSSGGSSQTATLADGVDGGFSLGGGDVPRITMHMMALDESQKPKIDTSVQTTVSLRSY